HTRSYGDWSSDVCSSDLKHQAERAVARSGMDWVIIRPSILVGNSRTGESESDKMAYGALRSYWAFREFLRAREAEHGRTDSTQRSEERRVGKGGEGRGGS